MLTITNRQLQAMQKQRDEAFVWELVEALRLQHRDRVELWAPDIHRAAQDYLGKARGYGVETDRDLSVFISLQLLVARDWDEFPPLNAMLKSAGLDTPAAMETILSDVDDEDWQSVRQWATQRG